MLVTTELLNKVNACLDQVKLFQKLYPQGIDIPEDPAKAQKIYDKAGKAGLYIRWWLKEMKLTGVVKRWHHDGKLQYEAHYQNGILQDPKDGTTAVKEWHSNGKLQYEYHYQNGEYHDPEKGTPAVKRWYPDGKPEHICHYQNGVPYDPEDGTAAERHWRPDEKLEYEFHYKNGGK